METSHRNRRRNYFIKKRFQTSFIIKFCSLVVLGAVISGAIIYAMSKATVTTTFDDSRLTIKSTADFILPAVLLASAVVIIVIGLATIVMTLFTSHRIAGPLYRMEKDVGHVALGNFNKRFSLRHGDEIKPLAESLDAMVSMLRVEINTIKDLVRELNSDAAAIEKDDGVKLPPRFKKRLADLMTVIEKFKT
ncbi:MAG: methyl-accepting chemotaxis protein [Candidatus Omnitrophota bacterium]